MTILFDNMNHEQIKSYVLDSLSSVNERLFSYNTYIAHLLARKKNQELKVLSSLNSSSLSSSYYDSLLLSLSSEDNTFALDYYNQTTASFDPSHLIYFYYGSSSHIFHNVFNSLLPSDFNMLYDYMIQNSLLKKIGTNLGKAHLFSSQIAYHDFSPMIASVSYNNYSDAVDSMIKDMSNLKKDRDHLLLLLDIKDIDIQNLETKINELAHKSYIASTFTWS